MNSNYFGQLQVNSDKSVGPSLHRRVPKNSPMSNTRTQKAIKPKGQNNCHGPRILKVT